VLTGHEGDYRVLVRVVTNNVESAATDRAGRAEKS